MPSVLPLVYSIERLILQFGFEIALYRLESPLTSVGIVCLVHKSIHILPL